MTQAVFLNQKKWSFRKSRIRHLASGFTDEAYIEVGAVIVATAEEA